MTSTISRFLFDFLNKPLLLIRLFVFVFIAGGTTQLIAAETFPSTLEFSSNSLQKQGVGKRKKAFLSLYTAGLYLGENSDDGAAISAADEPMAIRLNIVSGLISSKKMKSALWDGFEKATKGDLEPIKSEIELFASGFADEIVKKDVFDLVYLPGDGVEVLKNGQSKVTVSGLAFKQALFGIWLSDDPIQASLKRAMLGAK